LLKAFAGEAALAMERASLVQAAREAETLKDSDATKTVILNSISHDLKTPLATIKAATSSLLEPGAAWTEGDLEAFLANIESEADRLDRTISELLDLNRLQSGAVTPLLSAESLADIAASAIEFTAGAIGERELVVSVPDLMVRTDVSLLRQSLANLLQNAAVHSRPGGSIRLEAGAGADGVSISVADEGPSPDAADLPFIFEPFYRSRQAGLRHTGTGLGLAIVKGFVSLCGGTVAAATSPAGSVFTIKLPRSVCVEEARSA
jgi:two-component system sensor histidine kinase KdpD